MDQPGPSTTPYRRPVYLPQPIPDTFAVEEPEDLASIHRKFQSWQEQVECHFQVLRDISLSYCDFPEHRQEYISVVWNCIVKSFYRFSTPIPPISFFNYLIRKYTAMNEEDYKQLCEAFEKKFKIPRSNEEVCPRSLYDQAYRAIYQQPENKFLEEHNFKPNILS